MRRLSLDNLHDKIVYETWIETIFPAVNHIFDRHSSCYYIDQRYTSEILIFKDLKILHLSKFRTVKM